MCNRYETPEVWEVERFWHIGREDGAPGWVKAVYPRAPAPAGVERLRALWL